MVKIVYPGTNRETLTVPYKETDEPWFSQEHSLTSMWPEGRIIADDNLLEGL